MPDQTIEQSIEFTPEAKKALEERTKSFAEDLRLAAIEEAIRSRGSASEVGASDVLRAAGGALEQESLKAYEKKIDALAKMVESESVRNQMMATEFSHILARRLENLAGEVGINKERDHELKVLSQKLQDQSFASAAELRNVLAHELQSLRDTLEEASVLKSHRFRRSERLAWLYLASGVCAGSLGLVGALAPTIFGSADPTVRVFALVGLVGLMMASLGGVSLAYLRIRRSGPIRF
jgi:ribosomal protein L10